jgi:hypothetical protein
MATSFTNNPPDDRPDENVTARKPQPRSLSREDAELDDAPKLGSLAQKARGNQLGQIRTLLIFIGVFTVIVNAILAILCFNTVADETTRIGLVVIHGLFAFVGFAYILLGAFVFLSPVGATISALVIYLLAWAAWVALAVLGGDAGEIGNAVAGGWIIRVVIIVVLAKAIGTATAYVREQNA